MDEKNKGRAQLFMEYQQVTKEAVALLKRIAGGGGSAYDNPMSATEPQEIHRPPPQQMITVPSTSTNEPLESLDLHESIQPSITPQPLESPDPIDVVNLAILRREEIIGRLKEINLDEKGLEKKEIDLLVQSTTLETEFVQLMQQIQRDAREKLLLIQKGKALRDHYAEAYTTTEGSFIDRSR